jgi:hypothetical protein
VIVIQNSFGFALFQDFARWGVILGEMANVTNVSPNFLLQVF